MGRVTVYSSQSVILQDLTPTAFLHINWTRHGTEDFLGVESTHGLIKMNLSETARFCEVSQLHKK